MFAYLAVALWIGAAVCRMRRWIGVVALIYCVPALAFCTLNFGYVFLSSIVWLFVGIPEGGGVFILIFNTSLILFVVPFGYFCLLGILAGRRIAFSENETRRIVAEIDT